jgi:hypothetical protein
MRTPEAICKLAPFHKSPLVSKVKFLHCPPVCSRLPADVSHITKNFRKRNVCVCSPPALRPASKLARVMTIDMFYKNKYCFIAESSWLGASARHLLCGSGALQTCQKATSQSLLEHRLARAASLNAQPAVSHSCLSEQACRPRSRKTCTNPSQQFAAHTSTYPASPPTPPPDQHARSCET